MTVDTITSAVDLFANRLATLEHLLGAGAKHFSDEGDDFMGKRLAADMLPLGTQVAFTCNQPHHFSLWAEGASASNLEPNVVSMTQALRYIRETQARLKTVKATDTLLSSMKRLELGGGLYAELTGRQYLNDFLLPNFYFHLVTAYGILRMSGIDIGKSDYMRHLAPHVRQAIG